MKKDSLKIIYYHTISDLSLEYFPKRSTQTIDTFKNQINFLNKRYNIISLDEAINKYENNEKFSNNLVITTDDGFKENYTIIAPVLNDFNLKFTALLCNDLIDNKSLMWRNILFYIKAKAKVEDINTKITRVCNQYKIDSPKNEEDLMGWSLRTWPYNLKEILASFLWKELFEFSIDDYLKEKQPYLTSLQVQELLNNGFNIGSHSKSHPYFKNLSNSEITLETITATQELERKFNTTINSFSFPFEKPQDLKYLFKCEKILKEKFKVILGIHDKGLNHKMNPHSWERISMEFNYHYSLVNFYLSPIKQRIF